MMLKTFLLSFAAFSFANPLFGTGIPREIVGDRQLLQEWLDSFPAQRGAPVEVPTEVHHQFKDQAELFTWFDSQATRFQAQMSATRFDRVPGDDPRYAILQSYIHEIWDGFRALFPEQSKMLNEPPVIIVDSEAVNAFVPKYLLEPEKISHSVIVLTGFIDAVGGIDKKEYLIGMIGHELAHSVFRHLLADYQDRISKYYLKDNFPFGFQALRDPILDADLGKWAESAKLVGDLTYTELHELPSRAIGRSLLPLSLDALKKNFFGDSKKCQLAASTYERWYEIQKSSPLSATIEVASCDLPELNRKSHTLIHQTDACMEGTRPGLLKLLSLAVSIPESELEENEGFKIMATTFDQSKSIMSGFQDLTLPVRGSMRDIEGKHELSQISHYTYEEHADDISLLISAYLGLDPLGLAKTFRQLLPPDILKSCDDLIASGQSIPSGSFSDNHPSTCFRIGHLQKLDELLKKEEIESFAADYVKETVDY